MTAQDTKKRISIIADSLIHTRGYHGFSYRDIANEVGIRKASIHHHYPSKELLVLSVIDFHIGRFGRWKEHYFGAKPTELLYHYKEMHRYLSHNCTQICPVGMLTSEYTTLPEAVQDKVDEIWKLQTNFIEEVLEEGIKSREFNKVDIQTKAKLICTTFSAILKTIRISKDMSEFDLITDDIIQSILRKENE